MVSHQTDYISEKTGSNVKTQSSLNIKSLHKLRIEQISQNKLNTKVLDCNQALNFNCERDAHDYRHSFLYIDFVVTQR
jgi:hypothetical protein